MKSVSIIVYVRNGEAYVKDAIASCLNQSCRDTEVIIIDDASEDNSRQVIQAFQHPLVRFIQNTAFLGIAASWDKAIKQARGEYIIPMTHAERLAPEAAEEFCRVMEADGQAQFVYSNFCIYQTRDQRTDTVSLPDHSCAAGMYRISKGFMFSKKLYGAVGGFTDRYAPAQVYEFWVRAIESSRLIHHYGSLITTVSFPGKMSNEELAKLSLMEDVIRCYRGHEFRSDIFRPTELFLRKIWWGGKGPVGLLWICLTTFVRIFLLSPVLGMYFGAALCLAFVKRIFHPFVNRGKKVIFKLKVAIIKSRYLSEPQRIGALCLIPELVVGGSEKVVGDIVRGLSPRGYRFYLLGSKSENNAWCRSLAKLFDGVFLVSKNLRDPDSTNMGEYYFYLSCLVRSLGIKLILLSNAAQGYKALARLKADFPGIKVIDLLHVEKYGGAADEALQYVPWIDKRVSISHYLKDHVQDKYRKAGFKSEYFDRMDVIYNGNDMDEFNIATVQRGVFRSRYGLRPQTKIITYIGRLSSEKRPLMMVDIAKELFTADPKADCVFVVAGGGHDLKGLQQKIKACGLQDKFILTGMVKKERVKELLADSFAVLIVSYVEGLPLVMVEAMAMDVPVLTTDVGAVKEVIENGVNGFVLPSQENVAANFSQALRKMLQHPQEHQRMAQRVRADVLGKFSMGTMASRYEQVFSEVLQGDCALSARDDIQENYLYIEWSEGRARCQGALSRMFGHKLNAPYIAGRAQGNYVEWSWDGSHLKVENDQVGFYPLYYFYNERSICVSTSLEKVLEFVSDRALDYAALAVFFRLGFFIGDDTPFAAIKALPPCTTLEWKEGVGKVSGGFVIPATSRDDRDQAITKLIELFREGMKYRQPDEDFFCVTLSGGYDSRHIVHELLRTGKKPGLCITTRKYPPSTNEDMHIARKFTTALNIPHRIVEHKLTRLVSELKNIKLTHYCADEHAWIGELAESLKGKTNILYDGIAGGTLLIVEEREAEYSHFIHQGRYEEAADKIFLRWYKREERIFPHIFNEEFAKRTTLACARARLVEELKKHVASANPFASFNFWNRSRREIALSCNSIFSFVPKVHCPFLHYDFVQYALSIPYAVMDHLQFRAEFVKRANPQWSSIPIDKDDTWDDITQKHQGQFVRELAWHLLQERKFDSRYLRMNYILMRLFRGILNRPYSDSLWWINPQVIMYMTELEKLQSEGKKAPVLSGAHALC